VEVVALDYSECQHAGGGIHCSTLPLIRERS
jgi:N-dimethylarginine dimethylaminohydrolase